MVFSSFKHESWNFTPKFKANVKYNSPPFRFDDLTTDDSTGIGGILINGREIK